MRTSLKRLFPLLIILSFALSLHAQETAKILRVVDGDTLKINYKEKQESIRLIGIDAPESRVNPRAKRGAQKTGEDMKTILAHPHFLADTRDQ
jgi:micrococcal nuclease